MSWRQCTLYRPKDFNLLVVLPLPRRTSRCSPCSSRRGISCGITTTRPLLAVVTGDSTARQETPKTRRIESRLTQRRCYNVPATTDDPIQPTFADTRCAHLLASDREAADANEISCFRDRRVSVSGFIKTIRKQKHQAFADFTDGSCWQPIQVVLGSKLAAPLNNGTCLRITGKWKSSPGQGQSYELEAEEVHIYGTTDIEATDWSIPTVQRYPIQKKHHTPEFLRTVPHLRIRTPLNSVLARVRSSCLSFLNTWIPKLEQKGGLFVQVQPPIITTSDCEGAGEVFTVVSNAAAPSSEQILRPGAAPNTPPFFRAPKYLTVSAQLHLEAYAAELRNVWSISPAFRAEKSDTPRHLAEFYMLEMELSYVSTLGTLTALVESLIRSLVANLMTTPLYLELSCAIRASNADFGEEKAREVKNRWNVLLGGGWKSASYTYCMKQLREAVQDDAKLFEREPEYGLGLQLEHERWIVENVGQGRPIFVTHYPRAVKPCYMAPSLLAEDHFLNPEYEPAKGPHGTFESSESGEDTVACFDLLVPFGVGEMAGGGLREHRLENLIQNMREDGMLKPKPVRSSSGFASHASDVPKESDDAYPFLQPGESLGSLKWYADLRRYGTMPHGGFGIGWDRLLAYLTGVHNLRDVVPFPRSFGKADC